jgi:hypothetical protein
MIRLITIKKGMQSELELLKQIIDIPRLYISDYFLNLRTEIDIFYSKSIESTRNNSAWLEMINKVNDYEKECLNLKYFTMDFKNEINKQINEKINSIDLIKFQIEKCLFLNKTMFLYGSSIQLLFITDEYISQTSIESLKNK